MPTVSAVITAYNGEKFIERCLKGILSQTHPVDEIVVIDDGSTDKTPDILKSIGFKNLKSERIQNSGTARARVRGIKLATGDLVAFCDQDDVWLPEKIDQQLKALDGYDLVHSNAVLVKNGVGQGEYWTDRHIRPSRGNGELVAEFFNRNQILSASVLAKREHLLKALDAEIDYHACIDVDYSLWLRMLELGSKFTFVDAPLVEYGVHDQQISKSRARAMSLWQKSVIDSFLKRNPEFRKEHSFLVVKKQLKTHLKILLCSIP